MNLKEQLYVTKLAETGNLTHAAEQLYISQPALSLYIRNLERTLGVELFNRSGRRFTPTPAGELYLEKARSMLELRDRFRQELSELVQGRAQRLRVGMQSIRSPELSPGLIKYCMENHPQVRVQMFDEIYSTLEKRLLDGEIDLFFCNQRHSHDELEYVPLYEDEVMLIVNKNHPLVTNAVPFEDEQFPWIDLSLFQNELFILNTPMQSIRHHADQILSEMQFTPSSTFIIRGVNTIIALVNQGIGVGFTCRQYLKTTPHCEQIAAFRVGLRQHTVPFCAIYKKNKELSPLSQELIDWLRQYLQRDA